jgi:serine phosphatase RsbU (regulator of sigma subunit)
MDWHNGTCRIALIDGLGHGPQAAAAADAACAALAEQPALLPVDALQLCHRALAHTRGAAITVVQIDEASRRLTFTGVGNVEGRLWQSGTQKRALAYRGIVGLALPKLRSFDFELEQDWLVLLHTDGVSARFEIDALPAETRTDPRALAEAVLAGWARPTDDATVVVASPGCM